MNNSTTQFITKDKECYYLDLNKQPAHHMLRKCISKEDEYEYPCSFENRLEVQTNLLNSLHQDNNYIIERSKVENNIDTHSTIEGFVTDNGPGESSIPYGQCPDGYRKCSKTGKCYQVCTNCKYRDGYKSQYMNEYDPCFPEGIYNGRTNKGEIKCTCGNKQEYCNFTKDSVKRSIYTTDGSLFLNQKLHNNMGNYNMINAYFNLDQF